MAQAKEVEKKQSAARNADSKPSLPPARYAGRYNDAWYGEITIALEEGKPVLRFSRLPGLVGDLKHCVPSVSRRPRLSLLAQYLPDEFN
jgi:hypothetical protein